jgi:hypothetical protein
MKAGFNMTVLVFCLAAGLLGCDKGAADFPAVLRESREKSAPGVEDQVTMLYVGKQPDERREGIVLISGHPWGLKEPYLQRYAELLATDPDPSVRGTAALALGRSRDVKYVQVVAGALSDASERVRWDAASALDQLVGAEAIGPLRRHAVDDQSADVRACCAKALRHYDGKEAKQTLIQCLSDEAFAVRYQAHGSLVQMTHRDLGYEPEDWIETAGGKAAASQPSETLKRPWWDWMGVAVENSQAETIVRNTKEPESPWWDWMGVTENRPADRR